jgi:hypothetical protein
MQDAGCRVAKGRSTKLISMMKWTRTSRLSIKISLSLSGANLGVGVGVGLSLTATLSLRPVSLTLTLNHSLDCLIRAKLSGSHLGVGVCEHGWVREARLGARAEDRELRRCLRFEV